MSILIVILILWCAVHVGALENLALNKTVWEQYPWPDKNVDFGSQNAVDGQYTDRTAHGGQCTISEGWKSTATLRVDLGDVASISHINIYYRTDNLGDYYAKRMAGFFVYVSNTHSTDGSHLCYHHDLTPVQPPLSQSIRCSVRGRYVIYYNERRPDIDYPQYFSQYAYNELCEVEVYGCMGYYWNNCSMPCSKNCVDKCNISTGHCIDCLPGYQGSSCQQECYNGFYGKNCQNACSNNCYMGKTCNRFDGHCEEGCESGWTGTLCDQECLAGFYGYNCIDNCSKNCYMEHQCDRFTGHCTGGCKPGWTGQKCDQECSEGYFGVDCNKQCSNNCVRRTKCNRFTGYCEDGCNPGWKAPKCNDPCDETYYGINCTQSCGSNCVNMSCHHLTGNCKVYFEPLEETSSSNLPTVIGGSSAAIVMLLIIVGVLIYYRRTECVSAVKRNEEHNNEDQGTLDFSNAYQNVNISVENNSFVIDSGKNPNLTKTKKPLEIKTSQALKDEDVDVDETIHEENPYGDFYVNEESIIDIPISDLGSIIKEKSKNEDDGFKKEYATLLYGEKYQCDVGKLPENIPKNRFKTTFPYDHSRVILAKKEEDYINANYIDGIRRNQLYIATQGPKQNTMADFWLMIWQENVEQVVMLTNLTEGTKCKCVQYWPNLQTSMESGSFTINSIEEKKYAFFIVRKLKVFNKKHKKDTRTIYQYHYTAWPDHGTPEPLFLLLFHGQVTRSKSDSHNGPVLVHCSAGIGRTGTYIAVDVLFEEGKTYNKINIAEYVKKMRRNRMNMVQTYEQYKAIFLTLNEMFKESLTALSAADFLQKIQTERSNKPANFSVLKMEFQKLLEVRPQYSKKDYKVTSQFHDSSGSIQPHDRYVLFLTSHVPKRGRFINAISVPSFTNQNAFIVTKYPTRGDAVDFLRLITDYDSEVVVCMEPLCTMESSGIWIPTSTRSKTVTPFSVQLQHEHTAEIKRSNIGISKEGIGEETRSVDIVEPMNSLTGTCSITVSQILSMVSFARNIETEGPIVIASRDGAVLCGVFCAVYNLIQQLTMDEEVDVFSVVRLLQTRRPELCSTMEEYQLIHQALLSFIKSQTAESIYYNQ